MVRNAILVRDRPQRRSRRRAPGERIGAQETLTIDDLREVHGLARPPAPPAYTAAMKPFRPNLQGIGIFWIRREDYARFLEICTDRDKLPPTYEKWLYRANQGFEKLKRGSIPVIRAEADLDQFVAWCRAKSLNIDSHARTEYASYIAASQIRSGNESKH